MAWPSTGMTTMRPRNSGIEPITSPAATIRPQTAIGPGLTATARSEVHDRRASADIAVEQQRERHDADRQHQHGEQEADADADDDQRPAGAVVNTSRANASIETGGCGPSVTS